MAFFDDLASAFVAGAVKSDNPYLSTAGGLLGGGGGAGAPVNPTPMPPPPPPAQPSGGKVGKPAPSLGWGVAGAFLGGLALLAIVLKK